MGLDIQPAPWIGDLNVRPKPFVFVLMPFLKEFDDVYKLGIKPACEGAGAYAERVDEQVFDGSILERIYNQVSKADVIIADMTGRNSNVFYETGYAHALGKPVILITRNVDDIPFDLKHYYHIEYKDGINGLIPELRKRVAFAVERPREAIEKKGIEVYVDGKLLIRDRSESIMMREDRSLFDVALDFHNSLNSGIMQRVFRFGVITPGQIAGFRRPAVRSSVSFTTYVLPNSELMIHMSPDSYDVLPGAWHRAYIEGCLEPFS